MSVESTRAGGRSAAWTVWGAAWACAGAWAWLVPSYVPPTGGRWAALAWTALALVLLRQAAAPRSQLQRLLAAAAVFAACGVLDLALRRVEAHSQPRQPLMAWIAAGALRCVGEQTALQSGELLVENYQGLFRFLPTLAVTGLRSLAVFLLASGLLLVQRQGSRRTAGLLAAGAWGTLVFGLLFAMRILAFVNTDEVLADREHPGLARMLRPETALLALGLVAAALCLARVAHDRERTLAVVRAPVVLLLALCGLALGAGLGWSDSGRASAGRVLVDDSLSGAWEPAGRLLTEDRYGDFSAYSFAVMTEHLARRFPVTVHGSGAYTRELLDQHDVLVLKTAYQPPTEEEYAAIEAWVRRGGGLFVIGDHTDLGGMSTVLNRLIGPAGMQLRFDATGSLVGSNFDLWHPPLLPEHPISAGLGEIEFMTGCSIALSGDARTVLTVDGSGSTAGDYSTSSHFGTRAPDGSAPQGMLVLAAAAPLGAGRVVTFADSTVLSSFGYFMDARAEFTARCVAWLARRASPARWLSALWLALGVAAAALGLRARPRGVEWTLGGGALALGLFAGAWCGVQVGAFAVRVPEPQSGSAVTLGLVVEGGQAWLPPVLGTQPDLPPGGNMASFAQLPLRLGFETRLIRRDPRALDGLQGLVLLNPDLDSGQGEASPDWVRAVRGWVEGGGRLLLVRRGAHVGHEHDRSDVYTTGLAFEPVDAPAAGLEVEAAQAGRGRVVRVTGSELLDVKGLGHCMDYPGGEQRTRHQAVYRIFGETLDLPVPQRRVFVPARSVAARTPR